MLLTIVKFPEKVSFSEAARTIDASGSTIGRAKSNDWVLDDPERFLSSRHAQISCDDGAYYLTDLSTNGTFVNGADEPLGKGNRTPLKDGDRIGMGEYEFEVSLWSPDLAGDDPFAASPAPAPASEAESVADSWSSEPWESGGVATPSPEPPPMPSYTDSLQGLTGPGDDVLDPLEALDRAGQGGQMPPLPTDDFLDDWPGSAQQPSSGYESAAEHVSVHAQSMRLPQAIPEDWDLDAGPVSTPAPEPLLPAAPPPAVPPAVEPPRMPEPPPAANLSVPPQDSSPTHRRATSPVKPSPSASSAASNAGSHRSATADVATALFEALGVNADALSDTEQKAVAAVSGEFLREAVSGLIRVLGSRSSIKNEFRMSVTTIQPVENNPLKFSATVDDAIELMFVKRAKAYKPPLEAVREGFDGIADHQIAVIAGMRAAFENILRRFDPEQLQQRFDRQQKGGLMPGSKKARYWEAFESLYEDITRDPDEAFQMLFGDEFVQSYESQLTRLSVARKRGASERSG